MNTRIQELIEQATYIVRGANGCVWGNNVNLEKLAELIVRECAKTAEQYIDERCGRDFGVGVRLKEHFGVEK